LAHANLLQLVSIHGTDSVKDLGLLGHNKMLRTVGVIVVNGTRSVSLDVSRFSHFWLNLNWSEHSPVTISSRTGTVPRPGVCRPLT